MAVNDLISVPDYNNIRNAIVDVMSTGSATFGYGQNLQSTAVYAGDSVSKSQWDNLRFDIVNAIVHQTGSLPSITIPAEGDLIRYGVALPNYQYLTLANQARTNRFDIGTGQYATESGRSGTSGTIGFSSYARTSITITFASATEARYFFNSGGKIRMAASFAETAGGPAQYASWRTLLTNAGTVSFGGNSPAVNFYNLTTSDQTYSSIAGSSPYGSNRWNLKAKCNVANNSSGTATSITITSEFLDNYTDPGSPPPGDYASGSFTVTASQLRAVGSLYPNLEPASFSAPSPSYGTFSAFTYA